MEDKRIRKTKRNLKDTLVELLMEVPFEQISITELCKRADISRITFYSHYSDKYALVDEIFADMTEIGTIDYRRRQKENNPNRDLVIGYINVLTVFSLFITTGLSSFNTLIRIETRILHLHFIILSWIR